MKDFSGETLWVVGASSGIGEALVLQLLQRGAATIIVSARREERLQALARSAPQGRVVVRPLDISDVAALQRAAQEVTSLHPQLSRVIIMAGTYEPQTIMQMQAPSVVQHVAVNLTGVMLLSQAVLPHLLAQQRAQLVLCGSIASYIGLPNGQPYAATKAGLKSFAESLRSEIPAHVDIKLLNFGFVATELTAKNNFAMPMLLQPEDAARRIAKGLLGRGMEVHFPKPFTLAIKLLALLPFGLVQPLLAKLGQPADPHHPPTPKRG
jgi:short-subunit dehydrogenase